MYRLLILLVVLQFKLIGQETEVIKNTKVYLYPNSSKNSVIGEIFPGSLVTKLKKDKSGKFIKATIVNKVVAVIYLNDIPHTH